MRAGWSGACAVGSTLVVLLAASGCSDETRSSEPETFIEPPTLEPTEDGVRRLTVAATEVEIQGRRHCLRTYNGSLVGPTIRVPPGEDRSLRVDLESELETLRLNPVSEGELHAFNVTNLHTHGLHVSPSQTADRAYESDNVLLKLCPKECLDPPDTEPAHHACHDCRFERVEYRFDLDEDGTHPAGSHWYHAHHHGSTAIQLANGMAGALIVEGGIETEYPYRERIFFFQQIPFDTFDGLREGEECEDRIDEHGEAVSSLTIDSLNGDAIAGTTLVNGVFEPHLRLTAGQVERWRFFHAGVSQGLTLAVRAAENGDCRATDSLRAEPVSLHYLAVDGLTLPALHETSLARMFPGYRVDVLLRVPSRPGRYCLFDLPDEQRLRDEVEESADLLATIEVVGDPSTEPAALPPAEAVARWAKPVPSCEGVVDGVREIRFAQEGAPFNNINGKVFDGEVDQCLPLGSTEDWHLYSERGAGHPFHIHVNPFVLCRGDEGDGAAWLGPHWRDTIFRPLTVEGDPPTILRSTYDYFVGDFVMHCHILQHEDRGMMQRLRITPAPASGCGASSG